MKIQLRVTNEDQARPLARNQQYREELEKLGVRFVSSNPDLLLTHASLLTPEDLGGNTPIAILERIDASVIVKRKELQNPIVRSVIKNTKLRSDELNNEPTFYGRYHTTKVMGTSKENDDNIYSESNITDPNQKDSSPYRVMNIDQKIKLTTPEFSKVVCGLSFCHYEKMAPIDNLPFDFSAARPMDVHFIGTADYGKNTAITQHRKACIDQLRSLKGCNVVCGPGRTQSSSQYISSLLQTKIVVSPWGHGEACYRDFEAVFCGSVLLKPDTGFVDCWPDIYQNNITYVPCKTDFSDVQIKVDWIKHNWKSLLPMRKNTLNLIREARKPDNFAKHMFGIFERSLNK